MFDLENDLRNCDSDCCRGMARVIGCEAEIALSATLDPTTLNVRFRKSMMRE